LGCEGILHVQISSFMPRDETSVALLEERQITLPTLFVHGLEDELVPLESGKELAKCFSKGEMVVHQGAHFVPTCSGQNKQSMVKFLEEATDP